MTLLAVSSHMDVEREHAWLGDQILVEHSDLE
jgi:hypothetical protein